MDITEIKKLIPFYVADTLGPDEKAAVEEALKRFPEIESEVQFWRNAREATLRHVEYQHEGHLSPEQVVKVAEGDTTEDVDNEIQNHLRKCESCQREVEIIKETYKPSLAKLSVESAQIHHPQIKGNKIQIGWHIPRGFTDVFAAAAVVVLCFLILTSRIPEEQKPQTSPNVYASVVLPYQVTTRGGETPETPILEFGPTTTHATITIIIPKSTIDSIRYAVVVLSSLNTVVQGPDTLTSTHFDDSYDMVRIAMERKEFSEGNGSYRVSVKELLPPSYSLLTPESYEYRLQVVIE